jgi:hypothetical protein
MITEIRFIGGPLNGQTTQASGGALDFIFHPCSEGTHSAKYGRVGIDGTVAMYEFVEVVRNQAVAQGSQAQPALVPPQPPTSGPILLLELSPAMTYHVYVALAKHHAALALLTNYPLCHADSLKTYQELTLLLNNITEQVNQHAQAKAHPETDK